MTSWFCFVELIFLCLQLFSKFDSLEANTQCIETERNALLKIREGFTGHELQFSSWVGKNCCAWEGIGCSEWTGNVVKLDLGGNLSPSPSKISSDSLLELKYLNYLDLRENDFQGISIPKTIGSLQHLSFIDLSNASFAGSITVVSWNNLCNLRSLHLQDNQIEGDINEILNNLVVCSNSTFESLNLNFNRLRGRLPNSIGLFKNLRHLLLEGNFLSGPIPNASSFERLSNLEKLSLTYNHWEGGLSENHLQGLKKLELLLIGSLISNRSHVFEVSNDWVPPFSLKFILIYNCLVGPKFPIWLRTQKELEFISLQDTAISDTIPDWLWKLSPQIYWLDLSRNSIGGTLPGVIGFPSIVTLVDLSFNKLEGSFPLWPNVSYLDLGNNLLSGSIPSQIGEVMSSLIDLSVSGNYLNGSIPSSIFRLQNLSIIDLSNNSFSGDLQSYNWKNMKNLECLDLSKNELSGNIPASMCSLNSPSTLMLSGNDFYGEIFLSLRNCTRLSAIDLGENRFSGTIPEWIGERFSSLSILRIRHNLFNGNIPQQVCGISCLHIFDLGHNNLSGPIPKCLGNLESFNSSPLDDQYLPWLEYMHISPMELVSKGRQMKFGYTLDKVNSIDLSRNNLWGDIPTEIMNLSALGILNLSWNHLTGKIPEKIGALQQLETLDLSCNCLLGPIPPSMTSMTFLNSLNLSHNNLSGPIPTSNQFQTFNDLSIYEGNPEICGLPLSVSCHTKKDIDRESKEDKDADQSEDDNEKLRFYASMGLGFVVGFWTVNGSLILNKSWRYAYFGFLEKVKDWLFMLLQ